MKIEVLVNMKELQPEIEGITFPAEKYTINITRSDGRGMTKMEALTVLQTSMSGLKDSVRTDSGLLVGSTTN